MFGGVDDKERPWLSDAGDAAGVEGVDRAREDFIAYHVNNEVVDCAVVGPKGLRVGKDHGWFFAFHDVDDVFEDGFVLVSCLFEVDDVFDAKELACLVCFPFALLDDDVFAQVRLAFDAVAADNRDYFVAELCFFGNRSSCRNDVV